MLRLYLVALVGATIFYLILLVRMSQILNVVNALQRQSRNNRQLIIICWRIQMKRFFIPVLVIFVASCTKSTQLPNNVCAPIVCQKIYGHESDWHVISDDLARNIYRHNLMCEKVAIPGMRQ